MTKEEAANLLGTSVRGVERLVTLGKLHPRKEAKERGGFRWWFEPEDIERLKRERAAPKAIALVPTKREKDEAHAEAIFRQTEALTALVNVLGSRLALAPAPDSATPQHPHAASGGVDSTADLAHRLTLSLSEAARLSGLAEGRLRDAIHADELRAARLGRGWRIRPADLRAYVDALFAPPPAPRTRAKKETTEGGRPKVAPKTARRSRK